MEIKENLTEINYWKGNGSGGTKKNEYIVIHYVGAVSSAYNNSVYFKKTNRGASANYFVDENDVYRVVKDLDSAWHCGANKYYSDARNYNSIGIEMCCYDNNGKLDISNKVVERTIQLTKTLMEMYNIPASNVVRHYDVTHKNCPAPFVDNPARWEDFKNKLSNPTQLLKKSVDEVAREVINGLWGNGADRKYRLTSAGYKYSEVQAKVNEILTGKAVSNKKSVNEVAKEVINGKWGNGNARKDALTKAGYNYKEVQNKVNELLG